MALKACGFESHPRHYFRRFSATSGGSPARPVLEPTLHRAHLVRERLLLVAALVQLEHRVDAGEAQLEGNPVELGDHLEDVLGRALQVGPHRVQLLAVPVLPGEPALDLGDVLAGARVRAPQPDHGEFRGCHDPSIAANVPGCPWEGAAGRSRMGAGTAGPR